MRERATTFKIKNKKKKKIKNKNSFMIINIPERDYLSP